MKARHISAKHKFFISYLSFFIIPCLILGTIAFVWISGSMNRTSKVTYDNISANLCGTVDNKINELVSFSFRLSEASWVKKLMYMQGTEISPSRIDISMINEYVAQLETYCGSSGFSSYMAVCFLDKDFVVSSMGQVTFENFVNYDFQTSQFDRDAWDSLLQEANYKKLLFNMDVKLLEYSSRGIIFLQSFPVNNFTEPRAALVGFIPYDRLTEIITQQLPSPDIAVAMRAGEDTLFSFGTSDRDAYVSEAPSDYGYSLSLAVPKRLMNADMTGIRIIFPLLLLVLTLLGYVMSHTMAERSYRPLERLVSTLSSGKDAPEGYRAKNEFNLLEDAIQYLMEQEHKLSDTLGRHAPMLREAYLQKLLTAQDEFSEEFTKTLTLFGIRFPHPWLNCMVVDNSTESGLRSIEQTLEANGCLFYRVLFRDAVVYLLNFDSLETGQTLVSHLNALPQTGAVIGIGSCRSDIQMLSAAYDEAKQASKYRIFKTQTSVVEYAEIKNSHDFCYFPAEIESKLVQALENGNAQQCRTLLSAAVEQNLKNKMINANSLSRLIYGLCFTALHVCSKHDIDMKLEFNKIGVLLETSTEAALDYLVTFYEKTCELIRHKTQLRTEEKPDQLRAYVDQNLTNPALSLSMVAEAFHLQPSNMSKLFKNQYQMRFIDYVSNRRIELAKKLLMENKLDVAAIARSVGYDSDVTFRRVFKKITGISPTQYRS